MGLQYVWSLSFTLTGTDAKFILMYLLMDSSNHIQRGLVSPAQLIPRGSCVVTAPLLSSVLNAFLFVPDNCLADPGELVN